MADLVRGALRWVFGAEGTVALDDEMQIVMLATATGMAGVFIVSPIAAYLAGPFAVPEARVGELVTAFTAPSVLLVPVAGVLADRIGRKRILVFGLVTFGVAGAAVALTADFEIVLALRAIQGVGYAAINPMGVAILGDVYKGGRETTAQGLRALSVQSMALVSPPLAGALVLIAWQVPFLLYAAAIGVAAWAWVALPEAAPAAGRSLRGYATDLVRTLSEPVLAAVVLSFVVRFVISFTFFAYVSVLLAHSLGASAVESGFVVAAFGLTSFLGSTQVGRVAGALGGPTVLLVSFLATGAGMALVGVSGSYLALAGALVVFGIGAGLSAPVQKSLLTRLAPPHLRGGAVSAGVTFQSIGQAAGPLAMGILLLHTSAPAAFVVFGIAGGLAGAALAAVALLGGRGRLQEAA